MKRKSLTVALAAAVTLGAAVSTAHADLPRNVDDALRSIGGTVTEQNVTVPRQESGNFEVETSKNIITLPSHSKGEVRLAEKPTSAEGASTNVTITLPQSESAGVAQSSTLGGLTYDQGRSSTITLLPKTDGSIMMTTVIQAADAPTEFTYTVSGGEGSHLKLEEGGAVSLLAADGTWLGGVATPWAKDANGTEVPTRFTVEGNSLTQHIDITPNTPFPVIADPWWAGNMIDHTEWADDLWEWSPTLKVYPTLWGRLARFEFGHAAWAETLEETDSSGHPDPNTSSMMNQFLCHFDFVRLRAPRKESWNLDTKLPDRGYLGFLWTGCNYSSLETGCRL